MLLSIQALLSGPNPDDPLANDVAQHWKENEQSAIDTGMWIRWAMMCAFSKAMDATICKVKI